MDFIEDWWRHNGCWDREQASGISYKKNKISVEDYLDITDAWWMGLSKNEKIAIYDDFFNPI